MPEIPAICDTCGAMFRSGFVVQDSREITLVGQRVKCPRCGGWGHIPDGVYSAFGKILELMAAPARTVADLRILKDALVRLRASEAQPEEVVAEIKRIAPHLEQGLFPQTRSELYAFLALILTAITLLISQCERSGSAAINQNVDITNIYNTTIEQVVNTGQQVSQPNAVQKVGRNAPCPCGSGKKYKKCHGRSDRGTSDTSQEPR